MIKLAVVFLSVLVVVPVIVLLLEWDVIRVHKMERDARNKHK